MVSIVKICEIPVQLGVGAKLLEGNAVDDAPVSLEALLQIFRAWYPRAAEENVV